MVRVWRSFPVAFAVLVAHGCGGKTEASGSPVPPGAGAEEGGSTEDPVPDRQGGGGSTSSVRSGLPLGAVLGDLNEQEALTLCNHSERIQDEYLGHELFCRYYAVLFSIYVGPTGATTLDRALCAEELALCVEDPGYLEIESDCSTGRMLSQLDGCEATVGEYEACLLSAVDVAREYFSSFSCHQEPSDLDFNRIEAALITAECEALEAQCPRIFGDAPQDPGFPEGSGCTNTCSYAYDGDCDDGGPGSDFNLCPYGTDCADCGPR
jgi:hypothetical protein